MLSVKTKHETRDNFSTGLPFAVRACIKTGLAICLFYLEHQYFFIATVQSLVPVARNCAVLYYRCL